MGRLEGKVAIITGGAKGQGAVEVELFASEGATVVFGDVLDDEGRKVEARVAELGGRVEYIHLDVTSEDDWQRAVNLAESKYGSLDILVNNAGITLRHRDLDVTSEDWDRVMEVNAKGVFLGTKCAVPAMRRAGGGSIVNISSIAGMVGRTQASPAYAGLEGRRTGLHQVHRRAFRRRQDIRANSIHPGPIDTDMIRAVTESAGLQFAGLGHSTWTSRPAGGHRLRRALPRVRRVVIRHGIRACHRWRSHGSPALMDR